MKKFWTITGRSIKIVNDELHSFLNENGFYTCRLENEQPKIFIRIQNNKIKHTTINDLKQFCWEYLLNDYPFTSIEEGSNVRDEFIKSFWLFQPPNIILLKEVELKEVRDTRERSFLFYKNCYLEITKEKIQNHDYDDLDGHIWESDIIPRDFNSTDIENYDLDGEFSYFINDLTFNQNKIIESTNRQSLITIIGYLLHRFKDPSNRKVVILMDPYSDGNPNGNTGKTLFSKALGHIRRSQIKDGKTFKPGERFSLSDFIIGTNILVIDDASKYFNFEGMFSFVVENFDFERKNENKIAIPFKLSPKILLSTNYSVEGEGDSYVSRKVEFVFSGTFSSQYTPFQKYGHLFFDEWDQVEWEKFDSFMAYCLQSFLLKRIVKPNFNFAERTLKMNATPEFIEFMSNRIIHGTKYDKKEKYEEFLNAYPSHWKPEQSTFTRWIKLYALANNLKYNDSHSGSANFFELN